MQLRSLFLTELVCDMIAEQGHYKLQRPAQYSARSGAQSQVLSLPAEKSGNAEMFFFVDPGKYLQLHEKNCRPCALNACHAPLGPISRLPDRRSSSATVQCLPWSVSDKWTRKNCVKIALTCAEMRLPRGTPKSAFLEARTREPQGLATCYVVVRSCIDVYFAAPCQLPG